MTTFELSGNGAFTLERSVLTGSDTFKAAFGDFPPLKHGLPMLEKAAGREAYLYWLNQLAEIVHLQRS